MKKNVLIILIALFIYLSPNNAHGYLYILNDKCINNLYDDATIFFKNTSISVIRDARGIILRYEFMNSDEEYFKPNIQIYKQLEDFLAKIGNPVIIEVHTAKKSGSQIINLKNWELSTVIANRIESFITEPFGAVIQSRIHSVGYGEFLPKKNPSNNGGKFLNRVDIIILCNINGE